ncbi:Transcription factor spt8 [Ceratobasidium sp. 428]|nr:Transcription factor spt8 [Ceratobasidium sp. 428]
MHTGGPRLLRTLRNPLSSGAVSCVVAFPDGKHLACASQDNIRLWNVSAEAQAEAANRSRVAPFKIIAGHHGGTISQILVDATSRFMITASGNRGWFGESTRTVLVHEMKRVY